MLSAILVGFLTGFLSGMFGIGGATVLAPILRFYFGLSPDEVVGTSLAVVFVSSLAGALTHLLLGNVDKKVVAPMSIGGVSGIIFGSFVFELIRKRSVPCFDALLGALFLFLSLLMLRDALFGQRADSGNIKVAKPAVRGPLFGFGVGFATGTASGILGLGGGFILLPVFLYVMFLPLKVAVGSSLTYICITSCVGAAAKFLGGTVDVRTFLLVGLPTALGANVGARVLKVTNPRVAKGLLGLYFLWASLRFAASFLGR